MRMPGIVKSLSPGIAKAHLIYEARLFVLFCFVLFLRLRSLKPWHFMLGSWYFWKALDAFVGYTLTWFETVWTCSVEAIDYWTLFLNENYKSNRNWKLYWNLGAFLVFFGKASLWVRFNKIEFNFTIFRAKVWKTLILEWILLLEIQTNWKIWVWNGTIWCVHIAECRNFQFWKCEK